MRDSRLPSREETFRYFERDRYFILEEYKEIADPKTGDIVMLSVEVLEEVTQTYSTFIFEAETGRWEREE